MRDQAPNRDRPPGDEPPGDEPPGGPVGGVAPRDGPPPGAIARRAARGAMLLAIRSVVLRTISFGSTVVLARLLVPADFGVYGVIGAIATTIMVFGDVGLAGALIRQGHPPSQAQLRTVWTVQLGLAVTGIVVLWAIAPLVTRFPGFPTDADTMVRVIAVSVLLSAVRAQASLRLERELRFGPAAAGDVLGQVAFVTVAVGLALRGGGAWSFIAASVAQQAVLALVVGRAGFRWPGLGIDRAELQALLGFGLGFQAAWILSWARDGVVPAVVGLLRGAQPAGFVAFGLRLSLLVSSVDEIVGKVAFPAFSRLRDGGRDLSSATARAAALTGLVVVPAQLWVAGTAPTLVPFLFSDRWQDAVLPVQLLCLAMIARSPVRYLRQATFAMGASRAGLVMSSLEFGLTVGIVVPATIAFGAVGAAAAILIGALLVVVPVVRMAPAGVAVDWGILARILVAGAVSALAAIAILGVVGGPGGLAVAGIAAAALYLAMAWQLARPTVRLALDLVRAGGR